jgi:hypothetical protein
MTHPVRFLTLVAVLVGLGGGAREVVADDDADLAFASESLGVTPWLCVSLDRPAQWWGQPPLADAARALAESGEWERLWQRPESDPLRQTVALAERVTDRRGAEAVRELLTGRLSFALADERAVAVYRLPDERLARRLWGEMNSLVAGRPLAAEDVPTTYEVDDIQAALHGGAIVMTFGVDLPQATPQVPTNAPPATAPLTAVLDLAAIRAAGKAEENLLENPGALAMLGPLAALASAADRVTVRVERSDESVALTFAGAVDDSRLPAALPAAIASDAAARPLALPRTIFSAAWSRDLAGLWEHRGELFPAETVAALEKGDDDIRQQFSVFQVDFRPSRLVQALGTDFHVAVAPRSESPYRIEPADRLPAAVLAVSLRDADGFREEFERLWRPVSLLTAVQGPKARIVSTHVDDAKLSSIKFRDDPQSARSANKVQYNFAPTWTVAGGHFIVGSTPEIVTDTIRALAAPPSSLDDARASALTRQRLDFAALADAVADLRPAVVRSLTLERGWRPEHARGELDVLARSLRQLGRLDGRFVRDGSRYEYTWTLSAASQNLPGGTP